MKFISENIKNIIWDWNGTLLNDTDICISCMNRLLNDRGLPGLDHEQYMRIFTFPVRDYYLKAGFTFVDEPFEIPAHQFIDLYRKEVFQASLQPHVFEVLSGLSGRGYHQSILSAMEREFLLETMNGKGIRSFFHVIYGIDNHLGAGKTIAAKELMKALKYHPEDTVLIGDTLHDAEVANEVGVTCILVSHGHQSHERLSETGFTVIPELRLLLD